MSQLVHYRVYCDSYSSMLWYEHYKLIQDFSVSKIQFLGFLFTPLDHAESLFS